MFRSLLLSAAWIPCTLALVLSARPADAQVNGGTGLFAPERALADNPPGLGGSPLGEARGEGGLAPANQDGSSLIKRVAAPEQRIEMIVQTSRLLELKKRIPKAMVNNPDVVEIHPRAANVLQVVAKKPGYTSITVWDEDDQIYSWDVLVTGDARELSTYLTREFPDASLRVFTLANSVVISGNVDDPADIEQIQQVAEDFFPKVINRITVGGVQQVLLKVQVMEVSRSKMRSVGFDWGYFPNDDFFVQSVSGLITSAGGAAVTSSGGETFAFGLVSDNAAFFGFIEALRRNNLAKVLAEPNLVTVSGRPAFFNSGGEFPILVPQSLGTVSIEYKKFGTQVDFVPIVLSNGAIRLEVRPRISEVDPTRSVTVQNFTIPGLRVREVDTGVEMQAGQTLAIAGLVQTRLEAETTGIPWLMDLPYVGAPFRRVSNQENEIELVVMVTPELVHPLDCHEVPPVYPGSGTTNVTGCEMLKGYIEVPKVGGPHGDHGGFGYPGGGAGGDVYVEEIPPGVQNGSTQPHGQGASTQPHAGRPHQMNRPSPTTRAIPANSPQNQQTRYGAPATQGASYPVQPASNPPGFIGPTGYSDVSNQGGNR
jgi:pilus assembly protein CpaC